MGGVDLDRIGGFFQRTFSPGCIDLVSLLNVLRHFIQIDELISLHQFLLPAICSNRNVSRHKQF
jgi:hypothetical protein